MAVVVTCSCSARVRLPEGRIGKRLRCPRCRAELVAAPESPVLTLPDGQVAATGSFCPICQSTIQEHELALSCSECKQVHHRECWAEVGGCSTYGCSQAPALVKQETGGEPARTAWGDTKKCPVCAETIKSIALRCRYCGTDFATVDPLTVEDLATQERQKQAAKGLQTTIWILFAVSLLGCTAPITMIVMLAWFLPKRQEVAKAGPLYLVLGYVSLFIAVLYNVLLLFFVLFSSP